MDWVYVWSPRYRFFHELLSATTKDLSGFTMKPVFAEQHLFEPLPNTKHFLTGIPIKIHVIVNYIQRNMGKTFFFTDVDLMVFPEFSVHDLQPYTKNLITTMKEKHPIIHHNIGCLLIQCCPETLAFFQRVLQRIRDNKLLDQDAFHEEIPSLESKIGQFSEDIFCQSNMLEEKETYKIIQCLTSKTNPDDILIEKVLTIVSAFDISALIDYLPQSVRDALFTE